MNAVKWVIDLFHSKKPSIKTELPIVTYHHEPKNPQYLVPEYPFNWGDLGELDLSDCELPYERSNILDIQSYTYKFRKTIKVPDFEKENPDMPQWAVYQSSQWRVPQVAVIINGKVYVLKPTINFKKSK